MTSQGTKYRLQGWGRSESPGWFDVLPEKSARDVMCEWAHCCDEAANHLLPIAVAFWIIWIVSVEKCSSLTQNLMQICCTHSVIFNVTATQYTCSLNSVYHHHRLALWSCHCSHMCMPVHSLAARSHGCCSHRSHYITNGWTFSRQNLYLVYSSSVIAWDNGISSRAYEV